MMRRLGALYASVLVVMIGFGITLPVMTFYIERLALDGGSTPARAATHVGLITAAYPLSQLVFAPLWGALSDRIGRRPLIMVGIVGFALSQALFGIASGLELLYTARLIGGALSSSLLPAAAAYVADLTSESDRGRGIGALGIAVVGGTMIGPALGALLVGHEVHLRVFSAHLMFDGFSVPFLVAGSLGIGALIFALMTVPEPPCAANRAAGSQQWPPRAQLFRLLLVVLVSFTGIATFEATFSLFAIARYRFGTGEIAAVFAECGLVMIVAQLAGASIAGRVGERRLVGIGLGAMSVGFAVLVATTTTALVFVAVVFLGAGMAFVAPALTSMMTKLAARRVGGALGLQQGAQSLGQVIGAVVGTLLFTSAAPLPYLLAAGMLAGLSLVIIWRN